MRRSIMLLSAGLTLLSAGNACAQNNSPRNLVLFVPDGLRALMVTPETAPAMAEARDKGVNFKNPHSMFPTFTMANGSAMATGHYLGDTGTFSNTIFTGFPVPNAASSVTPFLENDQVLGDIDDHYSGNFVNEEALLVSARKAGYSTAAIGKLGPVGIQAGNDRSGEQIIVVDDLTGRKGGIPLNAQLLANLQDAGSPTQAPSRGENGKSGDMSTPGTQIANVEQQKYFVDVATKMLLPRFKAAGKPFFIVFWSRDPDGTQHNQGDSLGTLVPGINGPTSMAAIKNADNNLAEIKAALESLGLDKTTDIFVTADHGFSTISKQSKTSPASKIVFADTPAGQLPPGFVAIDLAIAMNLPLFDPDSNNAPIDYKSGKHPKKANGLLGKNPLLPDLIVAANGGSDLLYLPKQNSNELAAKVVKALLAQDYISGIFVDDSFGDIPGTLPLSAINLKGSALTPIPSIVINFKSQSTGCKEPVLCTAEVADTGLQQGQGMHGSFSRADTYNFMAAMGPDFNKGFVDTSPTSNADVGKTLAEILKLDIPSTGKLVGRVLSEAMPGGKALKYFVKTKKSAPSPKGLRTILKYQQLGQTLYFDVAGFTKRSVGLEK